MIGAVRVRARVRALRGESPAGRQVWIHRHFQQAGIVWTPGSFAARASALIAAAAVAGWFLAGSAGAVAGPAIAVAVGAFWFRRRTAGRLDRIAAAFPDAMRATADALRAGLSLVQAIELAAAEATPPLAPELQRLGRVASLGEPMPEALRDFAQRCPAPSVALFGGAAILALRTGADLAPILDGIIASARESERVQRELRAASAQGRLTATVVGGLPVAFLLVLGAGARAEVEFLTREPLGWALLGVGGALEAVGFLWIGHMAKPS